MDKLIIKNGTLFDPLCNIEGEEKDILIEEGKIVDKFTNDTGAKEINAKNKTIIPSAIDIHTHVASQQVNWARLLGTKIEQFQKLWNSLTLENVAKDYISKGYTFIVEANVFPSLAKHAVFNFSNLPILDKAMLLNVSNLWPLELEFQRGLEDDASVFLSDLLTITKSYGFKVYNPFESENWNYQKLRESLDYKGRLYNFTPLDVYHNLTKYNEHLGLPHSIHAHIEGYEKEQGKKNLIKILKRIETLGLESKPSNNMEIKRSQSFHIAHASSYNIDGNNSELIEFYNKNQNFDLDLAFLGFNAVNPLITSDRRLINSLIALNNPYKLIRSAVEFEGDSFATFRRFDKKNKQDCTLWANALDLALNIENKWQMQFSTNFPNYSHVKSVAEIATWLISENARKNFMKDMNDEFLKNNPLLNSSKELSFNEFVILTRSSPAKSLGIGSIKGNLGIGADADLNILDLNIKELDASKDYKEVEKSLQNIEYVLKDGKIVKKKEMIDINHHGKLFWAKGNVEKEKTSTLLSKKKEFYQKFYSIFYDSLQVNVSTNNQKEII